MSYFSESKEFCPKSNSNIFISLAKVGLTPSKRHINHLIRKSIDMKKTFEISKLYASTLFNYNFSTFELQNIKKIISSISSSCSKNHLDVISQMIESNNIEGAIHAAQSVNTHQVWEHLVTSYIDLYGPNQQLLDIIHSRTLLIDLHLKNLDHADSEKGLINRFNSTKIGKEFHFTLISKTVSSAANAYNSTLEKYTSESKKHPLHSPKNDILNHIELVKTASEIHYKLAPYLSPPSEHAINLLLWALININHDINSAIALYNSISNNKNWNKILTKMSYLYSLLADGLIKIGDFGSVIALTKSMESRNVAPNSVYYSILIKGLLSYNSALKSKPILVPSLESSSRSNLNSDYNELDGYSSLDEFSRSISYLPNPQMIDYALHLFNNMKSHNIPRTSHIYMTLMSALAKNNQTSHVQALFDSLLNESEYWSKKRSEKIARIKNDSLNLSEKAQLQETSNEQTIIAEDLNLTENRHTFFTSFEDKKLSELLVLQHSEDERDYIRSLKTSIHENQRLQQRNENLA
ncbi:hypothetical protein AYI69_g4508 [Smittium culicis]|uniref:Pentatricopeptide repeat-containing protein n=1 Tax=Smittium culicis TaxID=133412 RepID=A0A1R1YD42_9FUNG|nr:hypothetical protein AYI69_g4508 [Smittium culicis]